MVFSLYPYKNIIGHTLSKVNKMHYERPFLLTSSILLEIQEGASLSERFKEHFKIDIDGIWEKLKVDIFS